MIASAVPTRVTTTTISLGKVADHPRKLSAPAEAAGDFRCFNRETAIHTLTGRSQATKRGDNAATGRSISRGYGGCNSGLCSDGVSAPPQ